MSSRENRVVRSALVALAVALVSASAGFRPDVATIALITKVVPEVSRKSGTTDWASARAGDMLVSGDQVRTAKKSLAIIKFLDRSFVRLREQSELTITGETANGKFTKSVRLTGGALGFDVTKQREDRFRLTSPTSVASIRGTTGRWSGGLGNDTLIVVEGLVNLLNNVSNRDVDVPAGYIGFSNQDGSVSARPATADELAEARNAVSGSSMNELELEFRNRQGNTKQLKLRYRQE